MFFIENDNDLLEAVKIIENSERISVDTEFERLDTYFPELSLLQIKSNDQIFVIDCLKCDVGFLSNIFLNENILKIFHSSFQDIVAIKRKLKIIPKNIFDTQIAAKICDLGDCLSYQKLCEKFLNVKIDKTLQFSNWLKRPLKLKLIEYAANDVEYLDEIYIKLNEIAFSKNLQIQLKEEMKFLSYKNLYKNDILSSWKKISFSKISELYLEKVKLLSSLREEFAIKENVIRKKILSDKELLEIAKISSKNINLLDSLNIKIFSNKKFKSKILDIINLSEEIENF